MIQIGMEEIYRLETRDRPRLLVAMMRALAAEDSRISFEGALSRTELAQIAGVISHGGRCPKKGYASTQTGLLGPAPHSAEPLGIREGRRFQDWIRPQG